MPKDRESGYTFSETYDLYNEQLHYARSTYTLEQLDRWQADWNRYFARYGMEIPTYAHRVSSSTGDAPQGKKPPTIHHLVA